MLINLRLVSLILKLGTSTITNKLSVLEGWGVTDGWAVNGTENETGKPSSNSNWDSYPFTSH